MRKLIIALLCLGMLAGPLTAFAQEPTWDETVNFIKDKIKEYGPVEYDHKICRGNERVPCKAESIYFSAGENISYAQFNNCYLNDSDFTIDMRVSWSYKIPINRATISNVERVDSNFFYGRYYEIEISDFEGSSTVETERDSFVMKFARTKWGRHQCPRKNDNEYHEQNKSRYFYLYFKTKVQAEKVKKALDHLVKLGREKYPREKELF